MKILTGLDGTQAALTKGARFTLNGREYVITSIRGGEAYYALLSYGYAYGPRRSMPWADLETKISNLIEAPRTEKPATPKLSRKEIDALVDEAIAKGEEALSNAKTTPMVVMQRENPWDDTSEIVEEWVVNEGPCGFAWVNVRPGTSLLAKILKERGLARSAYEGGVNWWIRNGGQSLEKKQAYADAAAAVLTQAGYRAYAGSRMD